MQTKLREPTCHLDRTVKKAFECTPTYRLDHKDLVSCNIQITYIFYLLKLLFWSIVFFVSCNFSDTFSIFFFHLCLQIHFAVLQNGHYYLITLNLKAGRFEIMDSMRKEGNRVLMADAKKIIGSIKHFWGENYKGSKIDISKYKTLHIPTPMQDTT